MCGQAATEAIDTLLLPFLEAANETESALVLAQLISRHAEPIIKDIIRYKLRISFNSASRSRLGQDAEDVYGETVLQLLARLHALRADRAKALNDFRSYVAVTTYHLCDQYLRQKYPQRWHLKNRLRYVLTQDRVFCLWKSADRDLMCGLAAWRDGPQTTAATRTEITHSGRLQQLLENPRLLEATELAGLSPRGLKAADLLVAIFNWVGHRIEVDDLVTIVAGLWGVKDQVLTIGSEAAEEEINRSSQQTHNAHLDVALKFDTRSDLEQAWAEICRLPLRQRAALLLNLRDVRDSSALALLPITGVATIRQIAEALAMSAEKLAGLWNDLPLDDATIASILGVTRQQVINLRKTARERLMRKMKKLKRA